MQKRALKQERSDLLSALLSIPQAGAVCHPLQRPNIALSTAIRRMARRGLRSMGGAGRLGCERQNRTPACTRFGATLGSPSQEK